MRTLALAFRDLSEEEWEVWSESHRFAGKATDCREDRLAASYDEIEQDMMVSLKNLRLFNQTRIKCCFNRITSTLYWFKIILFLL